MVAENVTLPGARARDLGTSSEAWPALALTSLPDRSAPAGTAPLPAPMGRSAVTFRLEATASVPAQVTSRVKPVVGTVRRYVFIVPSRALYVPPFMEIGMRLTVMDSAKGTNASGPP